MKVLVYGGTGSQGSAVVQQLLEKGHEPYILTRQPEKAEAARANGAQVVNGDLNDKDSLIGASQGMDAVSLTIPFFIPDATLAIEYARHAIEAAKAAGVKILVYNTSGPVIAQRMNNPGYDMRQDIIDLLKESELPYSIIQPGTYMENLLGPWTAQGIIEQNVLSYPVEEQTPIGWLATVDLGKLIVAALENPQLAGTQFVVSGLENLTGTELAARFTEALGRPIRYRAMPLEEFAAILDQVLGPGAGEGVAQGYTFQRENAGLITMWTDMKPVLEKLPVQMTRMVDWVRQFAPLFSAQAEAQSR
ncbi:MAG: NmrA family NAD(P)-binding protein [Chloroflexota bacterium]|nr:NmrA family NAD(P)-binding protein [Chloroflexota bacterium]